MSSPILHIQNAYNQYLTIEDGQGTHLQQCLAETQEFKTQLRKLKAHLNKHILETKSLESNGGEVDKTVQEKLTKRRILIQDKLNKSYKQWDHSIKKHTKKSKQGLIKFNTLGLSMFQTFNIDDIYNNKISDKHRTELQGAIQSHISRYCLSDIPVQDTAGLLKYLQNVYNISPEICSDFIRMGQILFDLTHCNYESCWDWAYNEQANNHSHVIQTLRYKLYIVKGMLMTKTHPVPDVCQYFSDKIPKAAFSNKDLQYGEDAAFILTQLIVHDNISNFQQNYETFVDACKETFTQEYCSLHNLPNESPLSLVIMSGILSSQFFMKYAQIKSSAHIGWTTSNELPFDVDLPSSLTHFHPVFICPVLKEETTDENPPYSLACHHVISKKALDKLSKNGTVSFKCPYCPVQSTISKTELVRFVML
ncbi:similar to Saccharomyces cerevisiae YDR255C RMD5 Conserved protein [Maudiozyma barnettii]|uniref:GID complex catalytic subunit 2 n=1 Tax=Maudiozyma barnettii TaxID=61262 RepID=A0A8H2ZGW2_9SACH|nr:ubiquitin-protein ligase RMD5 [Kazachstania barnettii]CAB4255054.1 similar to Saccharomyces cerevisiae YDR255C RMD5 Conserved protein [Kazachstania barnettii]CAD1783325.1 similar to Saccharomyces cerevisiae YDR255C RMD5 Conserved protein [Kazachstania barnettii]